MSERNRRVMMFAGAAALALLGWLLYEMAHVASSHHAVNPGTPTAALIITPGRSIIAFYAFLFVLTLLPPLYFAALLWLPGSPLDRAIARSRAGRSRGPFRALFLALFVLLLGASGFLAGYASESLQTDIRLTLRAIEYHAGRERVRVTWREVQAIVLRWRRRSQSIELHSRDGVVRMDISAFAEPDRALLVQQLPRIAHLPFAHQRGPEEWVWEREARPPPPSQ